jgi:hypothetical protein
MKFKFLILALFLACFTVVAQGIFGTTESFSQTQFCKKYACDLIDRDDSFAATGTRYEYTINLHPNTIKDLKPKVVILRDIDLIREAKLILRASEPKLISKDAQAFSDFISSITKLNFSPKELIAGCKATDYSRYTFNYRRLKKAGVFNIYCVLSESGGRLKISKEVPPLIIWDKSFFTTSSRFFTTSVRMLGLDDEMDTFTISSSDENYSFDYWIDVVPIDLIKADFNISGNIRRIRQATANPYKEPIGGYVQKSEASNDERVIDSLTHDGYAIFLQNNFKSFQTKTLKGVRYLEVGGQDWVTPTRDAYRYRFSGFTRDGNFFVHFSHKLQTKILPKEASPDLDPNSPNVGDRIYKAFAVAANKVNQAKSSDFEPPLDKLDAFVNTLSVTSGK